jgi:hypothetical protein
VPLSPIKHSDWPLLTQPQPARVLMVAGLIAVFAAKSKSARVLGRGKPASAGGPALFSVVAFGEQQFGQERPVGQLLAAGGVGELAEAFPERRQPQQPARAVDRGVDGLLAGLPAGDLGSCRVRAGRAGRGAGHASLVPVSRLS